MLLLTMGNRPVFKQRETPLYCRCKECVARFGSNTMLCALHRGGVDKGKSRGTSTEAPRREASRKFFADQQECFSTIQLVL
jgi:hypothetical protein